MMYGHCAKVLHQHNNQCEIHVLIYLLFDLLWQKKNWFQFQNQDLYLIAYKRKQRKKYDEVMFPIQIYCWAILRIYTIPTFKGKQFRSQFSTSQLTIKVKKGFFMDSLKFVKMCLFVCFEDRERASGRE